MYIVSPWKGHCTPLPLACRQRSPRRFASASCRCAMGEWDTVKIGGLHLCDRFIQLGGKLWVSYRFRNLKPRVYLSFHSIQIYPLLVGLICMHSRCSSLQLICKGLSKANRTIIMWNWSFFRDSRYVHRSIQVWELNVSLWWEQVTQWRSISCIFVR